MTEGDIEPGIVYELDYVDDANLRLGRRKEKSANEIEFILSLDRETFYRVGILFGVTESNNNNKTDICYLECLDAFGSGIYVAANYRCQLLLTTCSLQVSRFFLLPLSVRANA